MGLPPRRAGEQSVVWEQGHFPGGVRGKAHRLGGLVGGETRLGGHLLSGGITETRAQQFRGCGAALTVGCSPSPCALLPLK